MTGHERRTLRRAIQRHKYLEVMDEVPAQTSFAVLDRRTLLWVAIADADMLRDLVQIGAEWFLESVHNGGKLSGRDPHGRQAETRPGGSRRVVPAA